MTFGARLQRFLNRKNMTVSQLIRASGISSNTLYDLLTGRRKLLKLETLQRLAVGLRTSPEVLLYKVEDCTLMRTHKPSDAEANQVLRARIRSLMRKKQVTVKELAAKLRVQVGRVHAVLAGKQVPPSWLPTLERSLGVSREDLLQGIDWKPKSGGRPREEIVQQKRRRKPTLDDLFPDQVIFTELCSYGLKRDHIYAVLDVLRKLKERASRR